MLKYDSTECLISLSDLLRILSGEAVKVELGFLDSEVFERLKKYETITVISDKRDSEYQFGVVEFKVNGEQ